MRPQGATTDVDVLVGSEAAFEAPCEAFHEEVLLKAVAEHGIAMAAHQWGDARKTPRLFRRASEEATERVLEQVTKACIDANIEGTDQEATTEKLLSLPTQRFLVLLATTEWTDRRAEEIVQPVTSEEPPTTYESVLSAEDRIGEREMRDVVTDLEMGLVETWGEIRGGDGRTKQVETTFDPAWVTEARAEYIA